MSRSIQGARLGAAAGACLLALAPALADSLDTPVTATGWTQVGAANGAIEIQPQGNTVILSTSTAAPATDQGPRVPPGGPPICVSLGSQPLWAKAVLGQALVKTTTVASCSGGGAAGQVGSAGIDYSANPPTLPVVGGSFAASGPFAGYVLVRTIPAAAGRLSVDVENTSGAPIVVLRDDGTANTGSTPANSSIVALAGGSAAGQQGGSWTSTTFRGRLQIYAPSAAAFVSCFVE